MSNFTDPIFAGLGAYLHGFHGELIGDTPAVREYLSRQFSKAVVRAPGRMVDQVEQMLEAWRKNNTSQAAQPTPFLPIMIVAVAKDFVPAPPEFARITGEPDWVTIPDDPKERLFKLKIVGADLRAQVVIIAADEPSARSLAMQLHGYMTQLKNRRFAAHYPLAGIDQKWPVQLESPEILHVASPTEQKNLTIMVADMTLRATIPMLLAPRSDQPNDGKGSGANQDNPFDPDYDPNGYLYVIQADGKNYPPPQDPNVTPPPMGTWTVQVEP